MELNKEKVYSDIMNRIDIMEGHQFEYFCAKLLEYNEFRDVTVTQGSGDYGVDIIARYHNRIYGIQCKRYSAKVPVRAVQDAISGSEYHNCDASAVITNSTFTPNAVKMAKRTGVRLWDRNDLIDFIDNCENHEFINEFIGYKNSGVDKADTSKVLIVDKIEIDDVLREKNISQINATQKPDAKSLLNSNTVSKPNKKNRKKHKFWWLIIIFILICYFMKQQKSTGNDNRIKDDNTLSFQAFEGNAELEDIIMAENHPKYMDSIVNAYKAWGNLETVVIMYQYPYYECRKNDSIIVSMKDKFDNEKITQLLLMLDDSPKTYSLADALLIVEDYFPAEENAQYYNFVESYYVQNIEDPEEHAKEYVIHYQLNDEAHQLRYEGKIDCVYNMYIYIWTDFDDASIIKAISFDDDFTNTLFDFNIKRSGREKIKWDYAWGQ